MQCSATSILCLTIGLLVLATSAVAQEALATRNPGFELDDDGDGAPDHWTLSWRSTHNNDAQRGIEKQEPDWAWDKQTKHSGTASIRCGVSRKVDDGVWSQEGVPIPQDVRYLKVTAWVRARDVSEGDGRVAVVFLGEDNKWLGADYSAITVIQDTDWARYTGYCEVPEGTQTARVRCWVNFRYSGTGTFWFDDLELVPVAEMVKPKTVYLDERPSRPPTDEERAWGMMLFSRNWLRMVFPNSAVEDDERPQLSASACPGEREPMTLAVRALRDLTNLRVTAGDLHGEQGAIHAAGVDVRSVRYHPKEGQSRWGPYNETVIDAPLFLEKRSGLSLAKGRVRPFWVTVSVPEDALAGVYEGRLRISADELPAEGITVGYSLQVHPFKLDAPRGVCFAMYAKMRTDPAWLKETFADMRAHGMTSIGLCGNSGLALEQQDDGVTIDWNGQSALELNMDEYLRAGFPEPMVWLMGGDIPKACEQIADLHTERFAQLYRGVIRQIIDHGEEVGWPQIIFQPIDEPFEHAQRLERASRLLSVLKSIPGLRTEEDGMNGRWENLTQEVYRDTDVFVLHDGPTLNRGSIDMPQWWQFYDRATRDGKTIWFYNIDLTGWHPEPIRFMTGFGLWKSRGTGVIEWAYMWPVRQDDPGKVYEDPRALLYRFPMAPGESGGPTLAYEAAREGVDDYRYLLTLHNLVRQAKGTQREGLANSIWAPIQAALDAATFEGCKGRAGQGNWTGACEILPDGNRAVRGDHKIDNNWSLERYRLLRKDIASGIIRLKGTPQG